MKNICFSPNKTEGLVPVPDDPKRCPIMMIGTQGRETNCIKGRCAMYDSDRDCCGIVGRKAEK